MEYKSVCKILFVVRREDCECYSNIPLTIFGFCEKFLRYMEEGQSAVVGIEWRKNENICGR